jgi:hypothetical protein
MNKLTQLIALTVAGIGVANAAEPTEIKILEAIATPYLGVASIGAMVEAAFPGGETWRGMAIMPITGCVDSVTSLSFVTYPEGEVVDSRTIVAAGTTVVDGLARNMCEATTEEERLAAQKEVDSAERKAKFKKFARGMAAGMANYAEGYNRGVNSARAAQNGGRMQTTCTTINNITTCN